MLVIRDTLNIKLNHMKMPIFNHFQLTKVVISYDSIKNHGTVKLEVKG